jgi:leucyl/phenylalanyl-tRNA--protein transferase
VVAACAAHACAIGRWRFGETWISHRIAATYQKLHEMGHAHSVECWMSDGEGCDRLVGGLYGVGFDRVFCGESMFSRVSEASKVALAGWWWRCAWAGWNCSTASSSRRIWPLWAREISQKRYLSLLREAQRTPQLVGGASPPSASFPNGNTGGAWAQARPCRCPRLSAPWRRP